MMMSVCAADRSIRSVHNITEMSNATDSKFDNHVSTDSPNMTFKIFL